MDNNRKQALAAALTQIERQFGKGSVMRMGDSTAARDSSDARALNSCRVTSFDWLEDYSVRFGSNAAAIQSGAIWCVIDTFNVTTDPGPAPGFLLQLHPSARPAGRHGRAHL